jgi:hypothetical protein
MISDDGCPIEPIELSKQDQAGLSAEVAIKATNLSRRVAAKPAARASFAKPHRAGHMQLTP